MSTCEAFTRTGPGCRLPARIGYTRCHVHDDRPRDYGVDLRKAVGRVQPVLEAWRAGKWAPETAERTLLHMLSALLRDVTP
jgi:hypothetical protein